MNVNIAFLAMASMALVVSGYQIHIPTTGIRPLADATNMKHGRITTFSHKYGVEDATEISTSSTRKQFNKLLLSTVMATTTYATTSNAFEGGVGGLGKTKPQTGVQFSNPDLIPDVSTISIPGDYNAELLAPDGTPVFLSFYAPWPMLKSQGIESRDLANAEAAFVQVAPKPDYYVDGGALKKKFFVDSIFGQTGKFGAYGEPTDVKVQKVPEEQNKKDLYLVTFTTLTPAMRESDRKVYISTRVVGDGVFMLVTGTTSGRFRSQEGLLRKVAESFDCVEAPKSGLRR